MTPEQETVFARYGQSVLLTEADIAALNAEIARKIRADYAGRSPLMLGVLTGCLPFLTDVCHALSSLDLEIAALKFSAYGQGFSPQEAVVHFLNPEALCGRDVIIVDEILDRGFTLQQIRNYVLEHKAASVKSAVLIERKVPYERPYHADYTGYVLDDPRWIIGYGCDYKGKCRHLPFIATLKEELQRQG